MPVSRLTSTPYYPPRFGGYNAWTDILGSEAQRLYERIMAGNGRIEVTHACASVLNGYIQAHPDKAALLQRRLRELNIPKERINQIFAAPPPPSKPSLKDPNAQAALKLFEDSDEEFKRILDSGRIPTYREGRRVIRRMAMQAHGDFNESHVSDGGKFGPIMEAWDILGPLLPKD